MFAGLTVDDDDDDDDDDEEEVQTTAPAPAPPPKKVDVYGGIDPDDLEITIQTLEAVAADMTLFRSLPFKALRQALGPLAEELLGGAAGAKQRGRGRDAKKGATRLEGLSPEERMKQMDRDALNHRVLRAERLERLDQLALEDGSEGGPLLLGGPSTDVGRMGSQVQLRLPDGPAAASGGALPDVAPATLNYAQSCYICKAPYRELHAFYAALCPSCAELNWRKRDESCDLRGKVALVTGGRMKIGYRIVLKLLRCGATVIATTRFPMDAGRRFASEADAAHWMGRLHVVGADFRDLRGLEAMCDALPKLVPRLDIIINNACQTVRRPPQYYLPLIAAEAARRPEDTAEVLRLTDAHRTVAAAVDAASLPAAAAITAAAASTTAAAAGAAPLPAALPAAIASTLAPTAGGGDSGGGSDGGGSSGGGGGAPAAIVEGIVPGMSMDVSGGAGGSVGGGGGAARSALMTAVPLAPGDDVKDDAAFPSGRKDANLDLGQQLDLRSVNSWMLKLQDVSTAEMAEVLAINSLAPAIINGRLREFMIKSDGDGDGDGDGAAAGSAAAAKGTPPKQPKFIVNVSAMEGRFYKWKAPTHPHTNMAKAALNMMTRTSAADYAKSGIYMTAVDTGWINDEKPAEKAAADANTHNFQTPIDEIDAAARVLDPIIAPLRRLEAGEAAEPPYGVFLKDYERCEW